MQIEKVKIKLLVIDVDGTMTDAGVYYDEHGNELKKFSTKDAAGFFAAREAGMEIMVLTGRECVATTRRMNEMKVEYLYQNIKNKYIWLKKFIDENDISKDQIAYIGDDLNDLAAMKLVGFIGCPADSCIEVKEVADYVSCVNGGNGAVRDIIEYILKRSGEWKDAINKVYNIGI